MNRKRLLYIYIAGLTCGALAIVAACGFLALHTPPADSETVIRILLLLPIGVFCSHRCVYFTDSSHVLLGGIVHIAAIMVLPPPLAILTVVSSKIIAEVLRRIQSRRPIRMTLVNCSSSVYSVSAAAVAFSGLGGASFLWTEHSLRPLLALPALLAMAASYYAIDGVVVVGAILLTTKERISLVIAQITRDTFAPEMSLIGVGVVFGILFHYTPTLSALIVVPVILSVRSFEAVARLWEETEDAVTKLAKSVDIRDTGTGIHSQQLEAAAMRLATALDLTSEHVHRIGLAARAHDLGKIELGDSILLKRGPLTPEERIIMEEHPVIGATMLSGFSAFSRSVPYVKHHHERWDGKGYPDGLKGEEIPLGARIITVVDSYDAMTADRPYRKALAVDEAVARLKEGMGTQFDARVCAAWIQLLIEDGTYVPEQPAMYLHLVKSEAG